MTTLQYIVLLLPPANLALARIEADHGREQVEVPGSAKGFVASNSINLVFIQYTLIAIVSQTTK